MFKIRIFIVVAVLLFSGLQSLPTYCQKKKPVKTVSIEVTDESGKPLGYSIVTSSRNRYSYTSDENGHLELQIPMADILKISACGYEERVISAADINNGKLKVTLLACPEYEGVDHNIYTLAGEYITENRIVGAYSKVDGSELEANSSMFLWDALGGRLNGLFVMNQSAAPGSSSWDGFVRAPNGGAPIVMVDGIERSLDYVEPETIESVQLLKDASLKSLFGGIQSNGILLIKTKRGKSYENGVKVNIQSGVEIPTRLPGYLNSMEYAGMYNQALRNIGLNPKYDPSKYDGTNDPLLYPDVDFYNYFLNDVMTVTRANAQLTGGNKNTRYFVHMGFQSNGGLEKFTDYPNKDQVLTVRGNIDNTIYEFITFKVGLNAAIQAKKNPNISTQSFFGILSGTRPNEYPVQIPGVLVGSPDEYVLGGTSIARDNPLGKLTKNGYVESEYSYIQSDFTIDFDFDKWVKGLSFRPSVTFDVYNSYSAKKDGGFAVYQPVVDRYGNVDSYNKWGYDNPNTKQTRGSTSVHRNWIFSTALSYDRNFGKHDIKAVAYGFMQQLQYNDQIHSMKRVNAAIWANYMYDKKYVVDLSANAVGLPCFAPGRRFGVFPTIGVGWVISENSFMKGVDWVDFLKLKASYGVLGSTSYNSQGIVSKYYYRDEYSVGGSYTFTAFNDIAKLSQTGNPDVGFQKSKELNAGLDFAFLGHKLSGSIGYFNNTLSGGLSNLSEITPGVTGKGPVLKWYNFKEYRSQGMEAELYLNQRFGKFELTLGGNFSYGFSDVLKEVDINYPNELSGLSKVVRMGDSKGYKVIGTYADQKDIESSPLQTFGKVYPGDLKYMDMNGDNIIDERDKSVIANVQPSVQYGISVSLKCFGFNLDLLGYGLAGFDRLLTNKYYQIYGERKYSDVLVTGLPNGNTHPVLRADNSTNNFVASDYWVVEGGYFKLRNAELGYTLPHSTCKKIGLNTIKLFVRGTNLFTISRIKDLDPECLDAGINDFPLFTTVTGGFSFSF